MTREQKVDRLTEAFKHTYWDGFWLGVVVGASAVGSVFLVRAAAKA